MHERYRAISSRTFGETAAWTAAGLLIMFVLVGVTAARQIHQANRPDLARQLDDRPMRLEGPATSDLPIQSSRKMDRILVRLRPGDHMILGSLDRSAKLHEVQIQSKDEAHCSDRDLNLTHSVDVRRIHRSMASTGAHDSRRSDVGVESVAEAEHRDPTAPFTVPANSYRRRFHLPVLGTQQATMPNDGQNRQYTVNRMACCLPVAETDAFRIYVAEGVIVLPQDVKRLVAVLPDAANFVRQHVPGGIIDVDQDGVLSIVIAKLSYGSRSSEPPFLGCVRAEDYLQDSATAGDIIYLDPQLLTMDGLPGVLIHEMAHAAVFCRIRDLRQKRLDVQEIPGWLNEAIAHSCEYKWRPESPNLSVRISQYLSDSGRWPLLPPQWNRRGISGRGPVRAAGLFFVESRLQKRSLREFIDEVLSPSPSAGMLTNIDFADQFRDWTVWMSEQAFLGRLPLCVRHLPKVETTAAFAVRGTAATWWQSTSENVCVVSAPQRSQLQVTIVSGGQQNHSVPQVAYKHSPDQLHN